MYITEGADALTDKNLIELLLFYSIKRKDTNEISRKILAHFDNDFSKLFSAEREEIMQIDGVGEKTAELIELTGRVVKAYSENGSSIAQEAPDSNRFLAVKALAQNNFNGKSETSLFVLLLNNDGDILTFEEVASGFNDVNALDIKAVMKPVFKYNSGELIVFSFRPDGSYNPTEHELEFIKTLTRALAPVNVFFSDYVIVTTDGSLSLAHDYKSCMLFENEYGEQANPDLTRSDNML